MAKTEIPQEITYTGIAASPGIAVGPIHVIARGFSAPEIYEISEEDIADERKRFDEAVAITKKQLAELQRRLESLAGNADSEIFEAHVMLLEDKALLTRVSEAIANRLQNAEYAFYAVMQNFLEAMRRIPDPYLRERTADIEDVCQRVLRNFQVDDEVEHDAR
jgi:phosphotransferase system enzyme I (PtsI)